jgi:hypothetical protein
MKKFAMGISMLIFCLAMLAGCGKTEKEEKVADLDFTVLDEASIPEELKEIIEGKKKEAFKLTYSDDSFLYIVVGYGEQATGGYSIQVNGLYLTEKNIYLNTDLLGPSKKEEVSQTATFPYIVLKMEYRQESVVFDS